MTVYSLTETTGNPGCYGVFSTKEQATEAAMGFIKSWGYNNVEESFWDGFHKCVYYGEDVNGGCFEICIHELNA